MFALETSRPTQVTLSSEDTANAINPFEESTGGHTAQFLFEIQKRFSDNVARAQTLKGMGVYNLSYSAESATTPADYIGNLLVAIVKQEERYRDVGKFQDGFDAPRNDIRVDLALKIIGLNLARDCRHCKTSEEKTSYAKAEKKLYLPNEEYQKLLLLEFGLYHPPAQATGGR